jgi:MerR family transcriptional regulator, light-induced transcriptional regulator
MDERSPIYNLKVVVSETGVKPETLRAWERRYGFPKPLRSPGGHRLYTLRDIRTINWLIERQKEGLSISRAVELWKSLEDSGQDPLHSESLSQPFAAIDRSSLEILRQEWVEACLDFDEASADLALTQAFAIAPPELVCFEILQKGMSEVGQRWFQGEVSVQQEHFTSSQAMNRLHTLLNAAPSPTREGVLLAVCPAGESHEFGLLLPTYLLRRQGWEVIYLGANVPLLKLEAAIHTVKPVMTVAQAQTLPTAYSLAELADFLERYELPLAYGGGIFNAIPSLINYIPGYYLGETVEGSIKVIEKILRTPDKPRKREAMSAEYEIALKDYVLKRPTIESDIMRAFADSDLSNGYTKEIRAYLLDHIEAGLSLGEIKLLEWPLDWIKEYITVTARSEIEYPLIIKSLIESIDLQMPEYGIMITDFLSLELD